MSEGIFSDIWGWGGVGARCFITKTCLYNFDPFKPHFYRVKLGFTWVYIIFHISAQKHRLWVQTNTHNLCFEQKYEKYQNFLSENFHFFGGENKHVFIMSNEYHNICFCGEIRKKSILLG